MGELFAGARLDFGQEDDRRDFVRREAGAEEEKERERIERNQGLAFWVQRLERLGWGRLRRPSPGR